MCVGTGIVGGLDQRKNMVCYLDTHCGMLLSERYWCSLVYLCGVNLWCIHMVSLKREDITSIGEMSIVV